MKTLFSEDTEGKEFMRGHRALAGGQPVPLRH